MGADVNRGSGDTRPSLTISDRLFQRLVLIFMIAGFVLLATAGVAAVWALNRSYYFSEWVDHTYRVESRLSELRFFLERAETARRGFLLRPEQRYYEAWRTAAAEMPITFDRIVELTGDNSRQRTHVAELGPLLNQQRAAWIQTVGLVKAGQSDAAIKIFRTEDSAKITRGIRHVLESMVAEEDKLLSLRREEQNYGNGLLYAVLAVAGVLVFFVGIASIVIIRSYTRDLARSQKALRALNENLEEAVTERTTDLQRANDEIQRFAYIVSHDLRSPLVNVMGFTSELASLIPSLTEFIDRADSEAPAIVTEDARVAIKEDLPEAIGFIRSSTEKMDRLINAILRLSREGRRTISTQKVDVSELFGEIRDSMQHILTEKGVDVRIEAPIPSIVSDRLALEQIFSNLIENAVKYLKPGRPGIVKLRGRREGLRILYEVEDNGRGIDPRDHERIFDLFRRSGTQDVPGEGIGLAHVRALAYRLGGIIDCDAALDRGAKFRLSLPATFSVNQEAAS